MNWCTLAKKTTKHQQKKQQKCESGIFDRNVWTKTGAKPDGQSGAISLINWVSPCAEKLATKGGGWNDGELTAAVLANELKKAEHGGFTTEANRKQSVL